MNQKNQRGSGDGSVTSFSGWSSPTRKERGPYYCGEGYTCISDELDTRLFTRHLDPAEFLILQLLSRDAWKARSLIIRAAIPFLRTRSGISLRSIYRHMETLRRLGFIRLHLADYHKGNLYFVEPTLLLSSEWHNLDHIEDAQLAKVCHIGTPSGVRMTFAAKLAWERCQDGSARAATAGLNPCHIGTHYSSVFSVVGGAPCQCLEKSPEGGEDVPAPKREFGQRSPSGQIQTPIQGQEGVGLSANPYDSTLERVRSKHFAKSKAETVEQPSLK